MYYSYYNDTRGITLMYCIFNFYTIYFLKFIVHTTNSKKVKYRMVKLIVRENSYDYC
jgi:hypothetical protein